MATAGSYPQYDYWIKQVDGNGQGFIKSAYQDMIKHYNQQKDQFLDAIFMGEKAAADNFLSDINNEAIQETIDESSMVFDEAFNMIDKEMENLLGNMIIGNKIKNDDTTKFLRDISVKIQNAIARKKKKTGKEELNEEDFDQIYKNLKKDLNAFLISNEITKITIGNVINLQVNSNRDIQNNLFGYARKTVFMKLKNLLMQQNNKVNRGSYKNALKGYYQEQLLIPLLNKALEKTGLYIRHTASITDEKNREIKYDLVLGEAGVINNLSDQELKKAILGNMDTSWSINVFHSIMSKDPPPVEQLFGGIQVKSWVIPFTNQDISTATNTKRFYFGKSSEFLPTGQDKHYWHAGVWNVMSNAKKVIGYNNFLFKTGNQFYWTADLLTDFNNQQYVLGYYWSKRDKQINSPEVQMLKHID